MIEAVRKGLITQRERQRPESKQEKARREAQKQAVVEKQAAVEQAQARVPQEAYQATLDTLGLSQKTLNHLTNGGLSNVGEVMERIALGDEALLMINGIGAKSLGEVKQAVEDSPFKLNGLDQDLEAAAEEAIEEKALTEEVTTEPASEETTDAEEAARKEVEPELDTEIEAGIEPDAVAPTEETQTILETTPLAGEEGMVKPVSKPVEDDDLTKDKGDLGIQFYEEEDTIFPNEDKKGKKGKKRGKSVYYDDESGETYVVRKRRRHSEDAWDEYMD